jgi:hypothetical protein
VAWFAFSLAGAAFAASAAAEEHTCPWITAGTAAAMLGGDVATYVVLGKAEDGSCRFVRHDQPDQPDQHEPKDCRRTGDHRRQAEGSGQYICDLYRAMPWGEDGIARHRK